MNADRHLMIAFEGTEPPPDTLALLAEGNVAGVTLFNAANVRDAGQVADLTAALRDAAPEPILVATDQEGGQLMALGPDTTPFAGAMALGATGDPDLARRVARAIGTELRALGVDLNYAPVCDVATNPNNPSLGTRSFSDDPALVAEMAAQTIAGLHEAAVLTTAKHFPGQGEAVVDPHHDLPVLDLDPVRLDEVELVPFRAAISAGVDAMMVGHYGLPSVTGRPDLPTSVAGSAVDGLLRNRLGFGGVVITDALDMAALPQGVGQIIDAVCALAAGVDLLLTTPDPGALKRLRTGLDLAVRRGLLSDRALTVSRRRIDDLRRRVSDGDRPNIAEVRSFEHLRLAEELARRSVTLVRDRDRLLPLPTAGPLLTVMPRPSDLTPADTSSLVPPLLAASLRRHHPDVIEVVTEPEPTDGDVAGALEMATRADRIVAGTISAGPRQARLVQTLLDTGKPVVTVALRTPFDLLSYPSAGTHLCTYSILEPSMTALGDVLFGRSAARGSLPVAIGDLHPRGWSA